MMSEEMYVKCCICGDEFTGWGNNPEPVVQVMTNDLEEILDDNGEPLSCCDECNSSRVIPARMQEMLGSIKYER